MLKVIQMDNGSRLIVETAPGSEIVSEEVKSVLTETVSNLGKRQGSEEVSAASKVSKASRLLSEQVSGLAELARTAIDDAAPQEVELEAHIKFGGGVDIIPFLAEANAEGGIKLTLKWAIERAQN